MNLRDTSLDMATPIQDLLDDLRVGENGFQGTEFGRSTFDLHVYIRDLVDMAKGLRLQPGWVPQSTYWLFDNTDRIVGMSRLRHYLSPALLNEGGNVGYYVLKAERGKGIGTILLQLTLVKARGVGLQEVLLTPRGHNIASIRVIEKNGGVLEDERTCNGVKYRRYWIRWGR